MSISCRSVTTVPACVWSMCPRSCAPLSSMIRMLEFDDAGIPELRCKFLSRHALGPPLMVSWLNGDGERGKKPSTQGIGSGSLCRAAKASFLLWIYGRRPTR